MDFCIHISNLIQAAFCKVHNSTSNYVHRRISTNQRQMKSTIFQLARANCQLIKKNTDTYITSVFFLFDVIFDSTFPPVSVLHRDAEEEAVVVETAGPEAVPLHAQESPPGHRRLPHAKEVTRRTRHGRTVQSLMSCKKKKKWKVTA